MFWVFWFHIPMCAWCYKPGGGAGFPGTGVKQTARNHHVNSGNWTLIPWTAANALNCWDPSPALDFCFSGISNVICHQIILCMWMQPHILLSSGVVAHTAIPVQGRLRQDGGHKFEFSPDYIGSFKPTWPAEGYLVSKEKQTKGITWLYFLNNKTKIETKTRLTGSFPF